MTFALALILLLIAVPFLLLLLDLVSSRREVPAVEAAEAHPSQRPGVILPGEGMVHRPRR